MKPPADAPSREELLAFIQESGRVMDRRELARAFRVKGGARADLKQTLRELEAEGLIDRGPGKSVGVPGALPSVTVVNVVRINSDGDLVAEPHGHRSDGEMPENRRAPMQTLPTSRSR